MDEDLKRAFGRRLTEARQARYPRRSHFIAALNAKYPGTITPKGYHNHEDGLRWPVQLGLVDLYAEMLETTRDWLLFGKGKQVNADELKESPAPINQRIESFDINTFKSGGFRYIPKLSASEIRLMLNGHGDPANMTGERIAVAQDIPAGPRTFSYTIPQGDASMVSPSGLSFPAGTHLMIDMDRTVAPGDFLLCWPTGLPVPVLRQLQAAFPLELTALRYPFKLVALHPMAEPITVESASDCEVLGRMITDMRVW